MINRLFVYGTFAPGRPNQHILAGVAGEWQVARIQGTLVEQGWGAAEGYPGVVLDNDHEDVVGFVFTSEQLTEHWQRLDEFEGEDYCRTKTKAIFEDGRIVSVYVYELAKLKD